MAPQPQTTVVGSALGPSDGESGSDWRAALLAAAALTGVVVLGAATTSFTGKRRRRHPASPYRSLS